MPTFTPDIWGKNIVVSDLRNNKEIEVPPHDVTLQQSDRPTGWDGIQPFTDAEIQQFIQEGADVLASGMPLDIPAFGVPTLTYLRLVKTVLTSRS
jgi:hypothetical protein